MHIRKFLTPIEFFQRSWRTHLAIFSVATPISSITRAIEINFLEQLEKENIPPPLEPVIGA